MVYSRCGPESSVEERAQRRLQIVYARKVQERQMFMDDLKQFRRQRDKKIYQSMRKEVGPTWYQALSVSQRESLDTLEAAIYQDLLERRPTRSTRVMRALGIVPTPCGGDLMTCVFMGRNDPKEMLAHLFLTNYGHPIDGKQFSYDLNARLMLSGIFYLGLDNLLYLLQERFRPDPEKKKKVVKRKPKTQEPLESPYLQKMIAALYVPPQLKRKPPAPLPNLDALNEPCEEDVPPVPKPPPPAPPPAPTNKKLPRSYCDKMAGYNRIEPHSSVTAMSMKAVPRSNHRKIRGSKMSLINKEFKKSYGMGLSPNKKSRKRKPVAPSTGMWNSQYTINGVFEIHGKSVYILNTVVSLPPDGYLIHGGYTMLNGEFVNIHCGICAKPPPPRPDPCDCVKKWQNTIFEYVRNTKCYCKHHYDYGNEGTFGPEELPFFEKATRHSPYQFNYQTIFNLHDKELFVEKEFKRIWDTESLLKVNDPTVLEQKDKKKKKKTSSTTCLGENPKPADYLRCALRHMRKVNVAARLPDVYLAPELREWMRKRVYGPYSPSEKVKRIRQSSIYWQRLDGMVSLGFGRISPARNPMYSGLTTWREKQYLNDHFTEFMKQYRLALFRAQANLINLMWATMYQAAFPDKNFRKIYFSYMYARMDDLTLMHPYCSMEALGRKNVLMNNRYCCIPDGIEPDE